MTKPYKRNLESFAEITSYFNKSINWLGYNSPHAKFIVDKYGIISIKTVTEYLNYQQNLRFAFASIYESGILTRKEITDLVFPSRKTRAHNTIIQFYNSMLYYRDEDCEFMFMRSVKAILRTIEAVKKKQEQINKLVGELNI